MFSDEQSTFAQCGRQNDVLQCWQWHVGRVLHPSLQHLSDFDAHAGGGCEPSQRLSRHSCDQYRRYLVHVDDQDMRSLVPSNSPIRMRASRGSNIFPECNWSMRTSGAGRCSLGSGCLCVHGVLNRGSAMLPRCSLMQCAAVGLCSSKCKCSWSLMKSQSRFSRADKPTLLGVRFTCWCLITITV